jgi:RNA polymerase sigma-70 factor, ECF subfamily
MRSSAEETDPQGQPDPLWDSVYRELRSIARQLLSRERPGHTLQATALVHEVFLRLKAHRGAVRCGRLEFHRVAASAMQRILIDHARRRLRQKRQQPAGAVIGLDSELLADSADPARLLDLEAALVELEGISARRAEIVRLRFYAGLTEDEIALLLQVSRRTVQKEFGGARAWLRRRLDSDRGDERPADG